ncbi:MAG: preprotein translocase subunit SecG [Bacteroidota bacterium]
MLYIFLVVLIAIICALLILVVLLQSGQGQGLSGVAATGIAGNAGLGARRTADLLSKATSVLGGAFLVLCVIANFAIERTTTDRSILQEGAVLPSTDLSAPAQTAPAIPQAQPPASTESSSGEDSEN